MPSSLFVPKVCKDCSLLCSPDDHFYTQKEHYTESIRPWCRFGAIEFALKQDILLKSPNILKQSLAS